MEFFVLIYNSYRRSGQSRNGIKNEIFAYCAMHFFEKEEEESGTLFIRLKAIETSSFSGLLGLTESREHIDKRAAEQE